MRARHRSVWPRAAAYCWWGIVGPATIRLIELGRPDGHIKEANVGMNNGLDVGTRSGTALGTHDGTSIGMLLGRIAIAIAVMSVVSP